MQARSAWSQWVGAGLVLAPLACQAGASSEARGQAGAVVPEPTSEPAANESEAKVEAEIEVVSGPDASGHARFEITLPQPRYTEAERAPTVALDEGHQNFGLPANYAVFSDILRADGFRVEANTEPFTVESLAEYDVLVIVNALHPSNVGNWELPTPSAFTAAEIDAVESWVQSGGGLWLIADHMPFPGAAAALASRFGFTLANGFAFRQPEPGVVESDTIRFRRDAGTIVAGHPITAGLEQLQSFTGEAFEAPPEATPLFVMPPDGILLLPTRAWEFDAQTPRQPAGGWPVAAVRELGAGRVAVFGEAAMLSARYAETPDGWFPAGVHHPQAHDNLELVLATARWLEDDA